MLPKKSKGFCKSSFSELLNTKYNISEKEANILFDMIGCEIRNSLESGNTVRLFNIGALKKITSKRSDRSEKIRFRESKRNASSLIRQTQPKAD